MTYDPVTKTWIGNEEVLGDFDRGDTRVRPALISPMNSLALPKVSGNWDHKR